MAEANFDTHIGSLLKAANISFEREQPSSPRLVAALQTASKHQTGKYGKPDFIAEVGGFVLVVEDKGSRDKMCLRDDNGAISQTAKATTDYAFNGALWYARKIAAAVKCKGVFALGCAGDREHCDIQPLFVYKDGRHKELDAVEDFEPFSPDDIESCYKYSVQGNESPKVAKLRDVLKKAQDLHEDLRSYGQLGETEKPTVVSAILLALHYAKTRKIDLFGLFIGGTEVGERDGDILYDYVTKDVNAAKVAPETKREQLLNQFTIIKDRPLLNERNAHLNMTPLRYFTEFIDANIYDAVVENSPEDYLGRFYGEFVSYSGGDGQTLGVVLTPRHITELFCDLVSLRHDDVVLDPCCGTGGFLVSAMSRMLDVAKGDEEKAHVRSGQLYGIEAREDMFAIATTNMILRGDGQSNLRCGDFFKHDTAAMRRWGGKVTVGLMNPPYSQANNEATAHLSELSFINRLLDSVGERGRVAVIVPVSAMIGKSKDDKAAKRDILKRHTLEGVISLNKNTFYGVGVVPCAAVFTAGIPHDPKKQVKFINFEDDGYEVRKHLGLEPTPRAKERRDYLLDCWRGNVPSVPTKFMVSSPVKAEDEWLHSFYYYNDEIPTDADFERSIADYLTFEFNMITHGRGYLFEGGDGSKKNALSEGGGLPDLNGREWGVFKLSSVFDIKSTSSGIDKNKLKTSAGQQPYITRTDNSNGVGGFVCEQPPYSPDAGNCITVGLDTQTAFYQPKPFYTGQNIQVLTSRHLNGRNAQFLLPAIKAAISIFSWGGNGATLARLRRTKLMLPLAADGSPDWAFTERYAGATEARLRRRYVEYARRKLESIRGGYLSPSWRDGGKLSTLWTFSTSSSVASGLKQPTTFWATCRMCRRQPLTTRSRGSLATLARSGLSRIA